MQIQQQMQEIKQEDTLFLEVMGSSPINKVLDFLIENDRTHWSMNEISEQANTGYSTLKLLLPKMLEYKLLIIEKKVGKIKFYKLNKENQIIQIIFKLHKQIDQKALDML